MFRKCIALLALSTAIICFAAIGCQQQGNSNIALSTHSQPTPSVAPTEQSNDNSTVGIQVHDSQTTTSSENSLWYPLHRTRGSNGEDIIFIDPQHGWKMNSTGFAAGSEGIVLFKTIDGGKNWTQISKTDNQNIDEQNLKLIPFGGIKTGITFLDTSTGWIGFDIPTPDPLLIISHDGGSTWENQLLPVLENNKFSDYVINPPSFFTKQDGLIIVENIKSLLYVTHNGGKNWTLIEQPTGKGSNGNLSWDFSNNRNNENIKNGTVKINNITWNTTDGGHIWSKSTENDR